MLGKAIIIACSFAALVACNSETTTLKDTDKVTVNKAAPDNVEKGFWTLYRNSPIDSTMRIHVASFDSLEGGSIKDNYAYNQENCVAVSKSLGEQVGVTAHFWCERGRYKK